MRAASGLVLQIKLVTWAAGGRALAVPPVDAGCRHGAHGCDCDRAWNSGASCAGAITGRSTVQCRWVLVDPSRSPPGRSTAARSGPRDQAPIKFSPGAFLARPGAPADGSHDRGPFRHCPGRMPVQQVSWDAGQVPAAVSCRWRCEGTTPWKLPSLKRPQAQRLAAGDAAGSAHQEDRCWQYRLAVPELGNIRK